MAALAPRIAWRLPAGARGTLARDQPWVAGKVGSINEGWKAGALYPSDTSLRFWA